MTLFQDSIVLHIPWRDLSKTKKTKSNIAKKNDQKARVMFEINMNISNKGYYI